MDIYLFIFTLLSCFSYTIAQRRLNIKVCGSDGKIYNNAREFKRQVCQVDVTLDPEPMWTCRRNVRRPKNPYAPPTKICATNSKTYKTKLDFKEATCKNKTLALAFFGTCGVCNEDNLCPWIAARRAAERRRVTMNIGRPPWMRNNQGFGNPSQGLPPWMRNDNSNRNNAKRTKRDPNAPKIRKPRQLPPWRPRPPSRRKPEKKKKICGSNGVEYDSLCKFLFTVCTSMTRGEIIKMVPKVNGDCPWQWNHQYSWQQY